MNRVLEQSRRAVSWRRTFSHNILFVAHILEQDAFRVLLLLEKNLQVCDLACAYEYQYIIIMYHNVLLHIITHYPMLLRIITKELAQYSSKGIITPWSILCKESRMYIWNKQKSRMYIWNKQKLDTSQKALKNR
jgi:hypothetical protein